MSWYGSIKCNNSFNKASMFVLVYFCSFCCVVFLFVLKLFKIFLMENPILGKAYETVNNTWSFLKWSISVQQPLPSYIHNWKQAWATWNETYLNMLVVKCISSPLYPLYSWRNETAWNWIKPLVHLSIIDSSSPRSLFQSTFHLTAFSWRYQRMNVWRHKEPLNGISYW